MNTYLKILSCCVSLSALISPCFGARFVADPTNVNPVEVRSQTMINRDIQNIAHEFDFNLDPGQSQDIGMMALLEELRDLAARNDVVLNVSGLDSKISNLGRIGQCIHVNMYPNQDLKALDNKTYTIKTDGKQATCTSK